MSFFFIKSLGDAIIIKSKSKGFISYIKELFKQAIIEAMEEKKDVVHDLLVEAMEDLAMIHAIKEGEETEPVSRDEVFKILEGNT